MFKSNRMISGSFSPDLKYVRADSPFFASTIECFKLSLETVRFNFITSIKSSSISKISIVVHFDTTNVRDKSQIN